ncbi:MAG: LysE family transporter [Oxalobacteraceae bacterium]
MTFETWLTFFLAACIIAVSPGSGAVLSMSHGLSYGVKKTSATILGLQAGLLLILVIAGVGVGSILLASEVAFKLVKTVGAVYLVYLGVSQWRSKVESRPDAAAQSPDSNLNLNLNLNPQHSVPSLRRRFLTGFLTNATNPKGIIFMVAVLPQFITQHAPLLPQLLILGCTMCAIDLAVMHGYAFAASTMQRFFRDPQMLRRQNRFFGGVLVAVGAALFFVKRTVPA